MAMREDKHSGSYEKKGKKPGFAVDSNVQERDALLILTLKETGCSVSELVNIKAADLGAGHLVVGARKVLASRPLIQRLREICAGKYVFASRQGPKLDCRRVQQIVKSLTGRTPAGLRKQAIARQAGKFGANAAMKRAGLRHLKHKETLDSANVQAVRQRLTGFELLVFDTLLSTGCRISELCQLKKSDLHMGWLRVGGRRVPADSMLLERLKQQGEQSLSAYVFASRQREHMSDKRLFQILKRASHHAGVLFNQRVLRNTRIRQMASSGHGNEIICRQLGISRLDFASYGLIIS
jgi:integrase